MRAYKCSSGVYVCTITAPNLSHVNCGGTAHAHRIRVRMKTLLALRFNEIKDVEKSQKSAKTQIGKTQTYTRRDTKKRIQCEQYTQLWRINKKLALLRTNERRGR